MDPKTPADAVPTPELLGSTVELLPAPVAYVDAGLRYVVANRAYREWFGVTGAEVVGRLAEEVTGPAFTEVEPWLREALAGAEQRQEIRVSSREGERTLLVTHLPHRSAAGAVDGVVVFGAEISEQRRAEAAVLETEWPMSMWRYGGVVLRQISDPIEAVRSLVYLVTGSLRSDPEQATEYLVLATKELERIKTMTADGRRTFRNLGPSLREMERLLTLFLAPHARQILRSGIVVKRRFPAPVQLWCQAHDMGKGLSWLLMHAVHAMPQGGTLWVRMRRATEFATGRAGVRVTIADTGSEMSKETQRKVFQPFYQGKWSRETDMSDAMWRAMESLMQAHGRVQVRSWMRSTGMGGAARRGLIFVVFLPEGEGRPGEEA